MEGGGAAGVLRPTTADFVPFGCGSVNAQEFLPGVAHLLRGDASEFVPGDFQDRIGQAGNDTEHMDDSTHNIDDFDNDDNLAAEESARWESKVSGFSELCVDADEWMPSAMPGAFAPHQLLSESSGKRVLKTSCRFFMAGLCRKGAACPFSHEFAQVQEREEVPLASGTKTTAETCEDLPINLDGVRCTFGPGLGLKEVLTDPQGRVSNITIGGLEHRVTDSAILGRLLPFGSVRITRKHDTYAFAKFDRPEDALAAVSELNGSPLDEWEAPALGGNRNRRGTRETKRCVVVSLASPPGAIVTHNASVKVQWYAPSRCAWAHYNKVDSAKDAASRCNGKQLQGRSVATHFQQPQARQRSSFSVVISGLSEGVSKNDVNGFMEQHGKAGRPASITMGALPFTDKDGGTLVERALSKIGPLASFQQAPHGVAESKRKALAKFSRASDAADVCKQLHMQTVAELGGGKLFVQRVFSAKFMLPNTIYAVVGGQLMQLLALLAGGDQHVRHRIFPTESVTTISVQADSPRALAFAKGMLHPLLDGECVKDERGMALWHAEFAQKKIGVQLEQLNSDKMIGQACVHRDLRRREIRVWGERVACEDAMAQVRRMHASIVNQPCAVPVKPMAFRAIFQVGQGVFGEIESACGASGVSLDWKTRSLIFAGDNDVVLRVQKFMAARLDTYNISNDVTKQNTTDRDQSPVCPICYCEPDADAVKLSCQHIYCAACLREWVVASCAPSGGSFPLTCLNASCARPVAIHDLKRSLSGHQTQALMRASLDEHVNLNLDKLQYCISPGCSGLHTLSEARTARCSACGMCICTSCKVEEHDGLTCSEHLAAKMPADHLRNRVVEEILTLHCPRCWQAFFDFDGCFALKCSKCPCAFCGWCLADCGTDAHPHVRQCSAKPRGADTFFGTRQQFEIAQQKRQKGLMTEFLATVSEADKRRLMQDLAADMRRLGIEM